MWRKGRTDAALRAIFPARDSGSSCPTGCPCDAYENLQAGFKRVASTSRKDCGPSYKAPLETGGAPLSDRIKGEVDVSAIAPRPPPGHRRPPMRPPRPPRPP